MSFEPGTLWESIQRTTTHAIGCGALHPIPTDSAFISEGGVDFLIRIVSNLARKDEAKRQQQQVSNSAKEQSNPFLPLEKDLFVADISDTHVAVLNKFNVVDHHLLIITRRFEDQETLLSMRDFGALWTCMVEYDGLAFYNGGVTAGASQRHKHLQMVPLPLATVGPKVPIEPLLRINHCPDPTGFSAQLPFVHALARIDSSHLVSPRLAAKSTHALYERMLEMVGIETDTEPTSELQSKPYNLLVTRQWMLLVPRVTEYFDTISINALGYAGALLVRNHREMQLLKARGPLEALKRVSVADDRSD